MVFRDKAISPYSPDTRRPWSWYDAERDQLWINLVGRELDDALERMVEDADEDRLLD